jgi:Family of unknown function (DUF5715)
MLRNVCIVLVLAALAATSAAASPIVPANARRLAHHKTVHATARATRRGGVRSNSRAASGRTAGRSAASSRRRPAAIASRTASSRNVRAPGRPSLRRASLARRRIVFPPTPLKGSLESLTRQNERTEADGLERILDEQDLADRIDQKLLVPIPVSNSLAVNTDLIETHRYCRPWTADFLSDLASEHAAQFHKPIIVSSAVRTVEYQQRLMRRNGNAAAAEGDIVSPHLTGGTVDIAKTGMSRKELTWMRDRLLVMQTAGLIDVEEEFRQPCFHITVYKNYGTPAPDQTLAPHSASASDQVPAVEN